MQQRLGKGTSLAAGKRAMPGLLQRSQNAPGPMRRITAVSMSHHQLGSCSPEVTSVTAVLTRQQRAVRCRAGFGGFSKGGGGSKSKDCPCSSGRLYSECCQVYHKSSSLAPDTPENLIRARYSAFVKREFRFLRATSHPDNPALKGSSTAADAEVQKHCSYEEDLAVTVACIEFVGLELLGSSVLDDGSSATVDVVVRLKRRVDEAGRPVRRPTEQQWRERAHLLREPDEGRWLVLDVTQLGSDGSSSSSDVAAAAEAV